MNSTKHRTVTLIGIILILLSAITISMVLHIQKKKSDERLYGTTRCARVSRNCKKVLTRRMLDHSLARGTQFLLNNQKPEGNFNYEYNFILRKMKNDDNQVRQAGALWGLALIYNDTPQQKLATAFKKGFAFFKKHSRKGIDKRRWVVYPGDRAGHTGTIALLSLAIIDFLRSSPAVGKKMYEELQNDLAEYIAFLLSLRRSDGLFHRFYSFDGSGFGKTSSYYNGETLLTLIKAARYLDRKDLIPIALESAAAMHREHVEEALRADPDSRHTKGYFQWGIMSYFELATSGWEGTEPYADRAIALADWMIEVHCTLQRTRNTAYAHEGIILAGELARRKGNRDMAAKFSCAVDSGLLRMTSWQVGGPIPNAFLRRNETSDPLAVGGVLNHRREPFLRIDVTQHQMHAVILARRYLYNL